MEHGFLGRPTRRDGVVGRDDEALEPRGPGRARRHRVDANPVNSMVNGHSSRELNGSALRRAVGGRVRDRDDPELRCHVDYRTAPGGTQVRNSGLGRQVETTNVDREDPLPFG